MQIDDREIGPAPLAEFDRLRDTTGDAADVITVVSQDLSHQVGNQQFVFGNHDGRHRTAPQTEGCPI